MVVLGGWVFLMSEVPLHCNSFPATVAEREGNKLKKIKHFHLENGSSQGQNLAVTVLFVPNSLNSGPPSTLRGETEQILIGTSKINRGLGVRWRDSEAGSCSRLIDFCITQL